MESTDLSLRLQAIIDTAIDGIITIDSKGIVETVNPAAASLFGFEPKEIIGNNISMLMGKSHSAHHDKYINNYLSTKIPKIIGTGREVQGKRKDNSFFPFRLAVGEVILNDRVIFTGIIHDLSKVKEAQTRIVQLNKELENKVSVRTYELENVVNKLLKTNTAYQNQIKERELIEGKLRNSEKELKELLENEKELNNLKSRFVSMASHEFRTPLTSILSSAELLSRYKETHQQDKREKHINRIKNAVNNLSGILNDFLSLSKLEEGRISTNVSTFNILELIAEVKDETTLIVKENQEIIIDSAMDDLKVHSDQHILKNILFNLVSNAIKYSSKDIKVKIDKKDGQFEIQVIDEGIGIPEEEQKYLFTRFFRSSNVTNIQGTGLGLTIVKRYLDIIKGDITFKSIHEQGTTFTIYFKDL
jgi:PAS domain S-box-containing protein